MLLFINEDKERGDRYFVFGRLIKDADFKTVGAKGTPLLQLKVSPGFEEDIATLKLWSADALAYRGMKKGTTVLADCRREVRDFQGKTYTDYQVNFIIVADEVKECATLAKGSRERTVEPEDVFEEIENPMGLPF